MTAQTSTILKGWKTTTLGEIADIIMGQSPSGESYNQKNDGLPFYQGITEFGDKYVDIKIFTNQPIKIIEANSILFSVRAPVGKVNFTKHKACIGRGNAGFKMKNDQQDFLYFLLKKSEKAFLSNTTGTVFDSISGVQLRVFEVLIPEKKEEQHAIAAVLSSLDDRIEILREQNKTLEATAQAIFKEWFVNFNFPGANGKMIDSELGKIPEGWLVGKMGEFVVDLIPGEWGKDIRDAEYSENVICLRGTDLPDLKYGSTSRAPYRYIKKGKLDKVKIKIGDLITEISGGTIGQSTGRIAYFNEEIDKRLDSNIVSSNFCKVLRLKDIFNQSFVFFYWEYLYKTGLFFNFENGTTGIQNLNLKGFLQHELVLPNEKALKYFCLLGEKTLLRVQTNNSQIQTLSALRDALLPKLIKGEVRVKGFNN